jgi:hypothetical protein
MPLNGLGNMCDIYCREMLSGADVCEVTKVDRGHPLVALNVHGVHVELLCLEELVRDQSCDGDDAGAEHTNSNDAKGAPEE